MSDNGAGWGEGKPASIFAENRLPALSNGLLGNNSPLEEEFFNYCNRGTIGALSLTLAVFKASFLSPGGPLALLGAGSISDLISFCPYYCSAVQTTPCLSIHPTLGALLATVTLETHLSPLVPQWPEDSCLQCVGRITPSPNDSSQGRRGKEEEAPKI